MVILTFMTCLQYVRPCTKDFNQHYLICRIDSFTPERSNTTWLKEMGMVWHCYFFHLVLLIQGSPLEPSVANLELQALFVSLTELSDWHTHSADAGLLVCSPGCLMCGLSQVLSSDVLFLCWRDTGGPAQGLSRWAESAQGAGAHSQGHLCPISRQFGSKCRWHIWKGFRLFV